MIATVRYLFLLFILLVSPYPSPFIFAQAPASEKVKNEETTPPDPLELKGEWTKFYEADSQLFDQNAKEEALYLQKLYTQLTSEQKEVVAPLIEKINLNLSFLAKAKHRTIPLAPEAKEQEGSYSVTQIIDVYRALRLKSDDIQTLEEEYRDKKVLLQAAQEGVDKNKQEYEKIEGQSEKKLVSGLQLILTTLDWLLLKEDIVYLEKFLNFQTAIKNGLSNELSYALNHMSVTREQIQQLREEEQRARLTWIQDEEFVKNRESLNKQELSNQIPSSSTPSQDLLKASILEAVAHQRYLFTLVELNLASLIYNPDLVDLTEMNHEASEWGKQLDNFTMQGQTWTATVQKQLQRSLQTLALIKTSDTFQGTTPTVQLQEKILSETQSTLFILQQFEHENDEARFLHKELNRHLSELIGGKTKWLWDFQDSVKRSSTTVFQWLSQTWFTINSTPITPLSLIRFFLILLFAGWLSRFVLGFLSSLAQKHRAIEKSVMYRINRLIYYLILTMGLLFAMSSVGFDFSSFALVAGALGVGLGFGLQAIFNNFISGIILLFESQLKVGDFIELESGNQGEIREIHVRNTILKTRDGAEILVPNSQLISTRITNWTLNDPYRRLHIPFSLPYGIDMEKVSQIVVEAAKKVPSTLKGVAKADPAVHISKLTDTRIEMELVVWVNEKINYPNHYTVSSYLSAIEASLKEKGISFTAPL